jgi:AraC-like DNA-binding protein
VSEHDLLEVGLGAALPSDPGATVPWEQAALALERVFERRPDEGQSLWMGAEMSVRMLNVVGLAMMSAKTVRSVVQAFVRFAPLVLSDAEFSFLEEQEEAVLRFVLPPASPRFSRSAIEFVLGACAACANELHQQDRRLRKVSVRYAAPPYASEYHRLFQCPVVFGAPDNEVRFDRADLDLPLPGGDETLHRMLCERAEHAVASREGSLSLSERAKELMGRGERLDGLNITKVAKELKLSASALQRKLKDEGTNYSQLLDDVRRQQALATVVRADVPIKELAERLGFSETSAFHRAFRRWTGQTPRQFRDGGLREPDHESERDP